jgi:hypothetical protein
VPVAKAVCDGEFRGDVEDLGGLRPERCLEQERNRLLRMPGIFYHDSRPRIGAVVDRCNDRYRPRPKAGGCIQKLGLFA